MAEIFLFRLVCVTTIGVCVFRCVASVAHLFYMLIGGYILNPQKIVTTDPKGDGNRRRDEKKRKKSLFFEKGLDFFAKV